MTPNKPITIIPYYSEIRTVTNSVNPKYVASVAKRVKKQSGSCSVKIVDNNDIVWDIVGGKFIFAGRDH